VQLGIPEIELVTLRAVRNKMSVELIEYKNVRYAEVIRRDAKVEESTFFSPPESSFQFGLLAHRRGYSEPPHHHKPLIRTIRDVQQMFLVQRGVVAVELYTEDGEMFREIILRQGDAIVLIDGIHSIRVIEDMQCISVKQGPFMGAELDKVFVEVKR